MGTKENPGQYDCFAAAQPDEPMFVLLARDPTAPFLVEQWAQMRENSVKAGVHSNASIGKVIEARKCASDMRAWRAAQGIERSDDYVQTSLDGMSRQEALAQVHELRARVVELETRPFKETSPEISSLAGRIVAAIRKTSNGNLATRLMAAGLTQDDLISVCMSAISQDVTPGQGEMPLKK